MPLPIGFFMPLPLPIMIPFMMWQSAAIAAGFGTYFQFAKRRVSAMSNEDFNKADPHELVNSLYEDIVKQIPSSFAKVDSLTPVMLQSMNVMLDQAVKWLQGAITGNFFGTPNPVNDSTPSLEDGTLDVQDLLSVSASTINAWSELKLFHEFENNLAKYDINTQQIITSRYNATTRTDVIPDSDFEPGIPLNKFGHILVNKNDLPDWHQITISNLNNAINTSNWYKTAGFMLATVTKTKCAEKRSQTSKDICKRQREQIQNVIIKQNKANIPNF